MKAQNSYQSVKLKKKVNNVSHLKQWIAVHRKYPDNRSNSDTKVQFIVYNFWPHFSPPWDVNCWRNSHLKGEKNIPMLHNAAGQHLQWKLRMSICCALGYGRVYLSPCEVADTPFHIPGDDFYYCDGKYKFTLGTLYQFIYYTYAMCAYKWSMPPGISLKALKYISINQENIRYFQFEIIIQCLS